MRSTTRRAASRQVSPPFPNINAGVICIGYNTCRKGTPHLIPHLSDGRGESIDCGLLSHREEHHSQWAPLAHPRCTCTDVLPTREIEARRLTVEDPEQTSQSGGDDTEGFEDPTSRLSVEGVLQVHLDQAHLLPPSPRSPLVVIDHLCQAGTNLTAPFDPHRQLMRKKRLSDAH